MRRDCWSSGGGGLSKCVRDGPEDVSGVIDGTRCSIAIPVFIEGGLGEAYELTIDEKFKFELDGID